MATKGVHTKPRVKTALSSQIAASTGLSQKQVTAVLEALAAQIKKALVNGRSVARTILGLVQGGKKVPAGVPAVKVTVVPELLPGPDNDCVRGLHKYFKSPATNDRRQPVCSRCGNDSIDWERLHKRDINDIEYTIAQLKTDRWNHDWWFKDFDAKAVQHALGKGLSGIDYAVRPMIAKSVGRVYPWNGKLQPYRDGGQTPYEGNIIFYGQHATATCCRKCIKEWHGIPEGRELTQEEMDYLAELLLVYIRVRFPEMGTKSRAT
jgi:hypothetical protein